MLNSQMGQKVWLKTHAPLFEFVKVEINWM